MRGSGQVLRTQWLTTHQPRVLQRVVESPGPIEFGVGKKVILATPTTLISLLKTVAYGWRQEAPAKNAQEVADLGRLLYERIAKLGEHWANVGDKLGKAVEAYNSATTTLESRVLVSARRLRELKAGAEGVEVEAIEPVEGGEGIAGAGDFGKGDGREAILET